MFLQNPLFLLTAVLAIPLFVRAFRIEEREWKVVSFVNGLLIVLLAVSAASPSIQTSVGEVAQEEIVYLDDKSDSMMEEGPEISFEDVSVERRVLAAGDDSNIKKTLLNAVEENQTYIVRTDLQGVENVESIARAYRERNSSIYALKTDLKDEASIKIEGPSDAVPGAENSYDVTVDSTNDRNFTVQVLVDGEEKTTETTSNGFSFSHTFSNKGFHRIEARFKDVQDQYGENNQYYKSVEVIEKPEVLIVGGEGQLNEKLSDFYDVTTRNTVPEDMSSYYSVVLKKKPGSTSNLRSYLVDGNGVMYTGDDPFNILPIREADVIDETSNPSMLMALDVSKTELCGGGTCDRIDVETSRTFAFSVVESLERDYPGTQLGMLAYSDGYIPMVEPGLLRENSEELKTSIKSLRLRGGDEYHQLGISNSVKMLNGSGNVILVTDGVPPGGGGVYGPVYRGVTASDAEDITDKVYKEKLLNYTENLPSDVKLFTVGVGNDEDKELGFLEDLAREGGGTSYESVDEFYENPPEDIGGGGYGGEKFLKVTDSDHFITSGLNNLRLATSDFSEVETKDSATKLIATSGGRPALSTWRYGLGRVAAFSTEGEEVSGVLDQRPSIISRTVAWTAGDPQRKKNSSLNIESARQGEEVIITSSKDLEGLRRISEDRYRASLTPNETGFHTYLGKQFSYNYRAEIEGLGYQDSRLEELTGSTGGKVLEENEIDQMKSEASVSTEKTTDTRSFSNYILLMALALFVLQVGYRKNKGLI